MKTIMSTKWGLGFTYATAFLSLGIPVMAATPSTEVFPKSGYSLSGSSQTFVFTATDTDGYSDMKSLDILFNSSFTGLSGCWLYFDRAANTLALATDDESAWNQSPLSTPNSLQNSQCRASWSNQSPVVTASGNTVTLSLAMTFFGSFAGNQQDTYLRTLDNQGHDSGYLTQGQWLVTTGPPTFSVAVIPQNAPLGGQDNATAAILPGATVGYAITITPVNGFSGPITINADTEGLPVTVQLNPSIIPSGSTSSQLTLSTATTMAPGLYDGRGSKTVGLQFSSPGIQTVPGAAEFGVVTGPPTLSYGQSYDGSTSTQYVNMTVADAAGVRDVGGVNILINYTFSGQNACWMFYDLAFGTGWPAYYANDDAAVWNRIPIGSLTNVANSQCSIIGGADLVPHAGATGWTIPIGFRSSPTFAGPKTIWVRVFNKVGFDTGYQVLGTVF
jgi:hypothetical protein